MTQSTRLAEVFVELADTLVEEFDVVEFLHMLTERSVELLEADAAGLMLADQRGRLQLMASSSERARRVELLELELEQGPCTECAVSGVRVVNVALADAVDRWPQFTPAALEAGFGATHALPMRLRGNLIGALNLFTSTTGPIAEDDLAIGQAMADIASIGLLHERSLREQTVLSEQLQTALHTRVLLEQAKGVLSVRAGIGVDEAFTRLRAHARRSGVTLTQVATEVVEGTIDITQINAGHGSVQRVGRP